MKVCFIADGRTSHSRNWIAHFTRDGHEAHLISTYPCDRGELGLASLHVIPLDFSARVRGSVGGAEARTTHGSRFFAGMRGTRLWRSLVGVRDRTAPWAARLRGGQVRRIVEAIQPEIVHALRIPFEGILADEALRATRVPLVIQSWGLDFILTAANSPTISRLTDRALARADGFIADCRRDVRIARGRGFDPGKPALVVIGNGGIDPSVFHPGPPDGALRERFRIPPGADVVINPRGIKPHVRNDTFFRAIPRVLEKRPNTVFLGAMMEANAEAEAWVAREKIAHAVRLLPFVPYQEMAGLLRLASVVVSLTEHDGTPNSVLESLACGLFPVVGDIETIRDWIDDGINGLICDQGDPESVAGAILRALEDRTFRDRAVEHNRGLIVERAEYDRVMAGAEAFYGEVIRSKSAATRDELGGRPRLGAAVK